MNEEETPGEPDTPLRRLGLEDVLDAATQRAGEALDGSGLGLVDVLLPLLVHLDRPKSDIRHPFKCRLRTAVSRTHALEARVREGPAVQPRRRVEETLVRRLVVVISPVDAAACRVSMETAPSIRRGEAAASTNRNVMRGGRPFSNSKLQLISRKDQNMAAKTKSIEMKVDDRLAEEIADKGVKSWHSASFPNGKRRVYVTFEEVRAVP